MLQIDKEREGEQIDRSLLKNVLDIFVEIGMGEMERYQHDFEVQMLDDTADYYKSKATIWIESDSCPDYMLKASLSVFCLESSLGLLLIYSFNVSCHVTSSTKGPF